MKRNNIFMWAYISFIGISVALRLLLNYSLWNPIIFAITFSSIFFAIEDFFALLYQTKRKSCDITDSFVTSARAKKEAALSFFEELDEKVEEYKETDQTLLRLQKMSQPQRKETEKLLGILNDLEKVNIEDRKKEKQLRNISHIFAYVGFLFLFVSLIVSTLIIIPSLVYEIITVISFAIILTTQQINSIFIERIEKENKRSTSLLKKIGSNSDRWLELKDIFDEFIEHLEDNVLITEETDNAD